MDQDSNDLATNGLGNSLTRDGQGQPTANLPMAGFRHTGVQNAVSRSDYAALGQAQDGLIGWTIASGTADAITATYTPALTVLADGQLCFFRATAANATTTPTFAPNGLTARTITKLGGAALVANDIPGNLAECVLRYNLANTRWELLNPAVATSVGAAQLVKSAMGFNAPVNLGLVASVGANLLTVAIKGADGNDPSAANPVWIPFRDSTIANGGPIWIQLTAALSISTFATGATLGSTNATPFRLWLVAFNNAGTVVLALINCSGGGNIFCPNETALATSTAMSGGATSSSQYYTPNGTTLTNKAIRILGYVEYAAGLATAGTYGIVPTTIQLFGPGVKKPGDTVQVVYGTTTSNTLTGTQSAATNMNVGATIAPTSQVNWVATEIMFGYQVDSGVAATFIISRGTAPTSVGPSLPLIGNGPGMGGAIFMKGFDPATTATRTSYNLFCTKTSAAAGNIQVDGSQSTILTEVMG